MKKGRFFAKSLLSSEPDFTDMLESMFPEDEEEERIGEPKPIEPLAILFRTSFCRPTNAPVKIKRILSVRTLYVSVLEGPEVLLPDPGVFDGPPEGGLLVLYVFEAGPGLLPGDDFSCFACIWRVVPSTILRRACWTPSPPTSLPWLTFAVLILSISSKQMIPLSA